MSNRTLLVMSALYGVDFMPPGLAVTDLDVVNYAQDMLNAFVAHITGGLTARMLPLVPGV
ncbi:hypothetical protein AMAG_19102 [Allomyces macrogynus ATCC 38327]|uniref:Uncharacterized protein n=1 Tax=Allomyces macrogynus (strain ATCC 38327) TaxID=578462 RepID=A0A0L0SNW5_ALLM3|nr:hypothetical protein AMAG_19102 [Allomyces macrogynus ATCC 38327]|eukprot:KNE64055.1 hypothetical protein AMAG_19102 [Allomyces macrogynus ATCC 38327]